MVEALQTLPCQQVYQKKSTRTNRCGRRASTDNKSRLEPNLGICVQRAYWVRLEWPNRSRATRDAAATTGLLTWEGDQVTVSFSKRRRTGRFFD